MTELERDLFIAEHHARGISENIALYIALKCATQSRGINAKLKRDINKQLAECEEMTRFYTAKLLETFTDADH